MTSNREDRSAKLCLDAILLSHRLDNSCQRLTYDWVRSPIDDVRTSMKHVGFGKQLVNLLVKYFENALANCDVFGFRSHDSVTFEFDAERKT